MADTEVLNSVAKRFSINLGKGAMSGWRWGREGAPSLLFCHATGFCASVYKQMLQALADEYEVYALDMRGHGRTGLPADPNRLRSWNIYAIDISAFLDAKNRRDWTLAGHSMGAVTAVMAAQRRADIAALRLIEPVAPPSWFAFAAAMPFWPFFSSHIPLAAAAKKRRDRWPSRQAVQDHYAQKAIFQSWAPGVLEDYLEDGIVDDDEGVRLACSPDWEAATFSAQANNFWGALRRTSAPVSVFAAKHPTSTVWSEAHTRFSRHGADITIANDLSHLAPMEAPARLARFLSAAT